MSTKQEKIALGIAVADAVEREDHEELARVVTGAVVKNNPEYGPYEQLLATLLGMALRRVADKVGGSQPWWRRILPW